MKQKSSVADLVLILAFVLPLIFFLCSIVLRFSVRKIWVEHWQADNAFVQAVLFDHPDENRAENGENVQIDWMKRYPFHAPLMKAADEKKAGRLNAYTTAVRNAEADIEVYAQKYLVGYRYIVALARHYDAAIHWANGSLLGYNSVVTLNDGYLSVYEQKRDMTSLIDAVRGLDSFVRSQGGTLVYVQCPYKICRADVESDALDFSNQNADALLAGLRVGGVLTLDLRDRLHESAQDASTSCHHGAFYRTDHHWKTETGLWAAGEMTRFLDDACGYGVDADIYVPARYEYEIYKDYFLGSHGKKLTLAAAQPEDFTMIYPKQNVSLHMEIPSKGVDLCGGFDVLYDKAHVSCIDYENLSPYLAYAYGDSALTRITNASSRNEKKLVVIKDSFGNAVTPFLGLGCKELVVLDLRYFTGSLETFLSKELPDAVIICYNPSSFCRVEYQTHTCMFDFK